MWQYATAAAVITILLSVSFYLYNQQQPSLQIVNNDPVASIISAPENDEDIIVQNDELQSDRNTVFLSPENDIKEAKSISNRHVNSTLQYATTDKIQNPNNEETIEEKVVVEQANRHIALIENELPIVQVTEIEDIQPLIPVEEETETMYASAESVKKGNNTVTNILNKIAENIEIHDSKNLRFSADEEGSIRVDLINSLVKNRFKKRK